MSNELLELINAISTDAGRRVAVHSLRAVMEMEKELLGGNCTIDAP